MAVKRKLRRGIATNIMCVLRHEGHADSSFFANRFRYATSTIDRALESLERQGMVRYYTVMNRGYGLTSKGMTATYRSKLCGHTPKYFAVTRSHEDSTYVPIRGARRRRRR